MPVCLPPRPPRNSSPCPIIPALTALLALVAIAVGPGLAPLASNAQAQTASAASGPLDLITAEPFDELTLIDNVTVRIEPVYPRPLPPFDLEEYRRLQRRNQNLPEAQRIPLPDVKLIISLKEGEVRDFETDRTKIKQLIYFEDRILDEARSRLRARDFARAFELLMRLKRLAPNWEGLDQVYNQLLFEEGVQCARTNQLDRGVRLLFELRSRQPDYPGLRDELANAYRVRISRLLEAEDYAESRRLLEFARSIDPQAPQIAETEQRFLKRAQELAAKARGLTGLAKLDTISQALELWPDLEGGPELFREAFEVAPLLDVLVIDHPRIITPFPTSPPGQRVADLLYRPLLAEASEEAARGQRGDQLAELVEKQEIGRKLLITLRSGLEWSDGRRPVSADDVAMALADLADPTIGGTGNARWARIFERAVILNPRQVELRLARTTFKPEWWLTTWIGPAHSDRSIKDESRVALSRRPPPITNGVFKQTARDLGLLTADAATPPPGTPAPKIARVRETVATDPAEALAALQTGRAVLLEHLPPDLTTEVAQHPRLRLGTYEIPVVHLIALDGRNPVLRNRTLRRGMSLALDRANLMEETILRRPRANREQPADGPFPTVSYANAPPDQVDPLEYDPLLAKMLVAAGKRELAGQTVRLTLEYPALPEVRVVIPRIVEAWAKAGVQVTPLEKPWSDLEERLARGERFDLAYRVTTCRDAMFDAGPILCPGFDAPDSTDALQSVVSPRILQLLLTLEQAGDLPTATQLAQRLDIECRDELAVLPLWQLNRHYAWHQRLLGPQPTMTSLYQGIATWEVQPWNPRER